MSSAPTRCVLPGFGSEVTRGRIVRHGWLRRADRHMFLFPKRRHYPINIRPPIFKLYKIRDMMTPPTNGSSHYLLLFSLAQWMHPSASLWNSWPTRTVSAKIKDVLFHWKISVFILMWILICLLQYWKGIQTDFVMIKTSWSISCVSWLKITDVSGTIPVPIIRVRCDIGQSQSQSHFTTDDQSVSASWFRALSGAHDQMLITVWQLLFCRYRAPLLTRGRVCHLS
jgi:hypothetical protein